MPITLPSRHNDTLKTVMERVNVDRELHQLWKCSNINAVDRSHISDHGEVHIRIVSNIALKICRLLSEGGVEMSVFPYGVNAVAGTKVVNIPVVLRAVSQGATFRQIPGKRLLTMESLVGEG